MAIQRRRRYHYVGAPSGGTCTLGAPLAASTSGVSETVYFSSALVTEAGPLTVGTGDYVPLTLEPGTPRVEVLWLVAYTPGDQQGTCLRGMEATPSSAHATGSTPYGHGPTPWDLRLTINDPWAGDTLAGGPYDYEFRGDTTVLPPAWVWNNQGGAVYTERYGSGTIYLSEAEMWQARGIERNLPALSSFIIYAKLTFNASVASDPSVTQFYLGGLYLRQHDTVPMLTIGQHIGPAASLGTLTEALLWSDATRFYDALGYSDSFNINGPLYLLVSKSSDTSWTVDASADGHFYYQLCAGIDPTTRGNDDVGGGFPDLNFTPDRLGIFVANNTGNVASVSCEYLRIR